MAYDAATSTVVLFGGYTGTKYLNDTWSWNGTAWSQLSPGTSPGIRAFTSVAYDAPRSTILVFGGQASGNPTVLNVTSSGSNQAFRPAPRPRARALNAIGVDASDQGDHLNRNAIKR